MKNKNLIINVSVFFSKSFRMTYQKICLIKNLYVDQEATVRTGHGTVEPTSPTLQTDSLPSEPPGKPFNEMNYV